MNQEKIDELLAVLDLPEEEQVKQLPYLIQPKPYKHKLVFCWNRRKDKYITVDGPPQNQIWYCEKCRKGLSEPIKKETLEQDICNEPDFCKLSLADLAFRMRDKAVKIDSANWGKAVLKICIKCAPDILYDCWWDLYAQPIHWIVAASIAEELAKEMKEKNEQ